MKCRGIRGAITVESNTREAVLQATKELLLQVVKLNRVEVDDVACVMFTTTPDLNVEFPAVAAREIGWIDTPLLCGHEMSVPNSLPKCIRILLLFNTEKNAKDIVHVYLKEAVNLRPNYKQGKKGLQGDHV